MKLPAQIGGLLVAAIAGGVAIAGEVDLSHPLHQAVIVVAALVTGLVGYFTLASSSTSQQASGPPFAIPDPLPTSAPAASAALTHAQVDERAAAQRQVAGEQGLP